MKNVVVITSSRRKQSSSRILVNEMVKGLKENNNVKVIDLQAMNLEFCRGCLCCQKTGKCIIKDDVSKVIDDVSNAEIIIFATPIYYYSISGQLKTFLDRLNPLYASDSLKIKEVYTLFTCADDNISAIEGPLKAIQGWIECFNSVSFKKSFNGLEINSVEDITDNILNKAFQFGREII